MLEAFTDYSLVLLDPEGRVTSWDAAATGRCELQRWCLRIDGSRFWGTVGISPLRNDDRTLTGYVALTRDGTQSRHVERELERREAYLEKGQRISHTGSWAWNPASTELFWSLEHFRILGVDPEVTRPSYELFVARVHPQDRHALEGAFAEAFRDRASFHHAYRIVRPDGSIRHVDSKAHPVFDALGQLIEYVGTIADVTERKLAEEDARNANARVKLVLDSITDKFFAFDSEWRYTFLNKHAEGQLEALGKVPSDLIGRVLWDEFPQPPSEQAFRQAMTERKMIVEEHYDAHLHEWVENSIYPSPDGGIAIFQRYISDRKRTEEALRTAQDELARVSRVTTLGHLTASIAHEVNQALTGVITNSNACRRWLSGETPNLVEAQDAAARSARDGQRASEVIARIRALLKGTETRKEYVDLDEVIQQVIALIQGELTRHNVALHVQPRNPPPGAFGDRVQLQQVVLNLVVNAVEAMKAVEDRPRELTISVEEDGHDQWHVSVRDVGTGLRAEDVERIFEAFYTTKPQGMGIGLSISRAVIHAHGGRLWASGSGEGRGATFHFTLPARSVARKRP